MNMRAALVLYRGHEEACAMKSRICLAAAIALIVCAAARADDDIVPPPPGARLILEAAADGVQIYTCEAKDGGFAWMFKSPEASLYDRDGRQVATHFAGPGWQANDGSLVTGEIALRADAPDGTSIPWLLLRAKTHEGSGILSTVAFIRRADTKAGAVPKSACDAGHAGEVARMRYSAVYQFYAAN
jgi:hypothetical protein